MYFCPFRIQFFKLRFFKYSWKAFNFVRDVLQVNRRYYHRFIQSAKEAIFIHCLRNKMCKSSELLVLTGIYILWLQDINKIKNVSNAMALHVKSQTLLRNYAFGMNNTILFRWHKSFGTFCCWSGFSLRFRFRRGLSLGNSFGCIEYTMQNMKNRLEFPATCVLCS